MQQQLQQPGPAGAVATRVHVSRRVRVTAISARAAQGYNEIELKRFSGHQSLRSLEVYVAHNREAAKRKARSWERRSEGRR